MKICLDAGHYGKRNQSPVVKEYYESEMNWKLHLLLKEELETYGHEVITTRAEQQKDLAVFNRGQKARGCDLFISLHSNACSSESVDRVSVFYSFENLNNAKVLAQTFADEIATLMECSKGQACTRESTNNPGTEYYGVLRGARSVNCPYFFIIEHSFHTNERAAKWLLEEENLEKIAELEAKIINNFFGQGTKETCEFNLLDEVKIAPEAKTWYNGKDMPEWVKTSKLYVRKINNDLITISTLKEGAVTGTVYAKDLLKVEIEQHVETPVEETTETPVEEPTQEKPVFEAPKIEVIPLVDEKKDEEVLTYTEEPVQEQIEEIEEEPDPEIVRPSDNIIAKIIEILIKIFKAIFGKNE